MRWLLRSGLALAAGAFVLGAASAATAQDSGAPASTPAPTQAPAAAAPTMAPLKPAPVVTPDPAAFVPPTTPAPIVFEEPFLQDAADKISKPAEAPKEAVEDGISDATSVTNPQGPSLKLKPHLQNVVNDGSGTTSAAAPNEVADRPQPQQTPVNQPVSPQTGDAAATDAVVPAGPNVHQTCKAQAVQHGVSTETGSIVQTAVQNEDCTWGGSQVLVSYDPRGPPGVDVLVQSVGVSVDVEAYVAEEKVRLGVGHRDRDGESIPVRPLVADAGDAMSPRQLPSGAGTSQTGSNRFEVTQDAFAESGDAVSGSQRVNVLVDGDARWVRVLAQHSAPGASAASGDAVSQNATVGGSGPVATQASGTAQASQAGDNVVGVGQQAESRSGDALAGSQELDVHVTGSVGEVAVLAQNASPNAVAASGNAVAANGAAVAAGPQVASGDGTATAGQVGSNHVDVSQAALATSGDAIASSQVIGITVGGSVGELAILASNDAVGARAVSGEAVAVNVARVAAGPAVLASTGDAMSAQIGSNHVQVGQLSVAESGRALAGAQVIAVEVAGNIGQSTVTPQNLATDVLAVSGDAVTVNDAAGSLGPGAAGSGNAMTQQRGENHLALDQEALPTTGDAVAGGQVTGIVENVGAVAAPEPPELFRPGAVTFLAA